MGVVLVAVLKMHDLPIFFFFFGGGGGGAEAGMKP